MAALRSARETISSLGDKFIAAKLHCAFIEADAERFAVLSEAVTPFEGGKYIGITKLNCDFAAGVETIRSKILSPFLGDSPLFVFADPFGVTDTPFSTFEKCTKGDTAELLINLDADGASRILKARNTNHESQLTNLFGTEAWKTELTAHSEQKTLTVQILDLYKKRLRDIGFRYVWPFAMRDKNDALNYYLVFATKHPLGMEKMKEAMQAIDKTGAYSFSDAHVDQQVLFRADDAAYYSVRLFDHFCGRTVSMEEVRDYALSETPFKHAKPMLAVLEKQQKLRAKPRDGVSLRVGSFPDEKIDTLSFGYFGMQGTLEI